jgi:hypothetical protein
VQSAVTLHWTHSCLVVSHNGVAPPQSALLAQNGMQVRSGAQMFPCGQSPFEVHSTQLCEVWSQIGAATPQSWLVRHATQLPTLSQSGRLAGQLPLPVHWTQMPVVVSQIGNSGRVQLALLVHAGTQRWPAGSHFGAVAGQSMFARHSTQRNVPGSHWGVIGSIATHCWFGLGFEGSHSPQV